MQVYFHGTDLLSATSLLNGADLDLAEAANGKIDGPPGFFLAAEIADAEFFALRRVQSSVVRFEISYTAMQQLLLSSAIDRPIPRGRNSPFFWETSFLFQSVHLTTLIRCGRHERYSFHPNLAFRRCHDQKYSLKLDQV